MHWPPGAAAEPPHGPRGSEPPARPGGRRIGPRWTTGGSRPKASARGRGRPGRPDAPERRRQADHIIASGHWAVAAAARRPAGPRGPPAPKPARRATALEPRPRGHPAPPPCTGAAHGLAVCVRGLGPAQAPGGSAARADGRVSFARAFRCHFQRPLVRRATAASARITQWRRAPRRGLSGAPGGAWNGGARGARVGLRSKRHHRP